MLERLRGLREDKDLKQQDIAEYLNIKQTTYSKYERGASNISADVLVKLAIYFDTSVDYILGLTDEMGHYPRKK